MRILLARAIGLNREEKEELSNLIRKWNLRRKNQNKRRISYWMQVDGKKRCSRDIWTQLHPKN